MIDSKIKKELLENLNHWLSKRKFSKKNLRIKDINKISNNFIKGLKKSCKKKLHGKKVKKNQIKKTAKKK